MGARLLCGPQADPLNAALHRAETDAGALADCDSEMARLPTIAMRRLLSTFIGTLRAQRWEGVPQLALAIAGGVLITWWLIAFTIAELRTMTMPPEGGPALGLVLWGLAFFTAGWLWALGSSVAVFRATRRRASARGSTAP